MQSISGQACLCPAGQTSVAGACRSDDVQMAYQLRLSDINVEFPDTQQVVESALFEQLLRANWIACRESSYANTTACQVVANLCVLQMYQPDAGACNIYSDLLADTTVSQHGWAAW